MHFYNPKRCMTYIHVAEGCWIESEMHRGRLIVPFLFAHGINRFSHNIAYVILVQLNLFIKLFVITRFWL